MKIGFWELIVIVIVAFVFIGPDQLPVYAKKIGKMLRELLLCDRIRDSAANAAAYYGYLLQTLGVARNSERTYEIVNELALFKVVELLGGGAYDLEYDRDRALFAVKICNS